MCLVLFPFQAVVNAVEPPVFGHRSPRLGGGAETTRSGWLARAHSPTAGQLLGRFQPESGKKLSTFPSVFREYRRYCNWHDSRPDPTLHEELTMLRRLYLLALLIAEFATAAPVTLPELLSEAFERNPDVRAAQLAWRASIDAIRSTR